MTPTERAGLSHDLAEAEYHGGNELSATGAKLMLDSPAKYRWAMDNPRPANAALDLGHVVHTKVLGVGQGYAPLDLDGRTKAGKEERAEVEASGRIALPRKDFTAAMAMADAVLTHPTIGRIFAHGVPEVSLFWTDPDTTVSCRGRIDWLTGAAIVDLKTTRDASPREFQRALVNYGYALQSSWYQDGLVRCGVERLPFVFVAVEKEPPYLVAAYQPDADVLAYGRERGDLARQMFRDCTESGQWPGYPEDIEPLTLPRWAA